MHGYNVWVHVELRGGSVAGDPASADVISQACSSLLPNAARSSNLAALSMHVTRMLRELLPDDLVAQQSEGSQRGPVDGIQAFSNRIAVVGKARATAGALNLIRILAHAVIVESTSHSRQATQYLQEVFTYKSRDTTQEHDTGKDLLQALLHFIVSVRSLLPNHSRNDDNNPDATTASGAGGSRDTTSSSNTIPELYDTTVLALQVVLTLLSSQLYQPMVSSFQLREQGSNRNYFWELLMKQATAEEARKEKAVHSLQVQSDIYSNWSPQVLLSVCLDWQIRRPPSPGRSIAFHNTELAESVVQAKGERRGADGMYESHLVVAACAPTTSRVGPDGTSLAADHGSGYHPHSKSNVFLDATKGVLVLSSSIILLPFRLMSLALGLWGHHREKGYDQAHRRQMQASFQSNRTKDVLWLTKSPIADLSSCLLLLLTNNDRALRNPFRAELVTLVDNRWEAEGDGLPDLPDPLASYGQLNEDIEEVAPLMGLLSPPPATFEEATRENVLTTNFEALFEGFGLTSHTEVGSLLLYTFLQASPAFADSIAVRSDLDRLVLPLLRTLYFASSLRLYAAQDYSTRAARRPSNESHATTNATLSLRNCPFRSQSQLYVIVILLLLFSQDASFGPDAFRRAMVPNLLWYKERHLKDISLGSVMILCILRSLSFNLNRLQDAFLLSNCCAVLMNLAPSIVDLHEYAAMRLAAVTVSSMKRYMSLLHDNPGIDEDDLSSPTAVHGEVARTLLAVLKHCLSTKNVDHNLHLVYALVYHQLDFKKAVSTKGT